VLKDASICVCRPPKELNNDFTKYPYKMLSFVEAKYFSKLNATTGLKLDDKSQLLTMFYGPKGQRYGLQILPFGLHVSDHILDNQMHSIFENLLGVPSIAEQTKKSMITIS